MDSVQSESGGIVMAIGALVAYIGALIWARQPGHGQRWLVVSAATGTALVVVIANLIAHAMGWWDWWGYALPLIVQGGLLFAMPSVLFVLLVVGYQWLERHSQRPLLVYGFLLLVILVPLTILGDVYNMGRGKLSFSHGYTIGQDVLLGQVLLWLPVVLYKGISRFGHSLFPDRDTASGPQQPR